MPNPRPVRTAEHLIASNRFVSVFMDDVRFPNGHDGTHLRVVEPTGGAVVLVASESGAFYLHRCYHYAANDEFLETVRGYGEPGERLERTALRELDEEAQFNYVIIDPPILLGYVAPNSTILAARVPAYGIRVRPVAKRAAKDPEESISEGGWHSQEGVQKLIASGEISDSFTLAALALANAKKWPS